MFIYILYIFLSVCLSISFVCLFVHLFYYSFCCPFYHSLNLSDIILSLNVFVCLKTETESPWELFSVSVGLIHRWAEASRNLCVWLAAARVQVTREIESWSGQQISSCCQSDWALIRLQIETRSPAAGTEHLRSVCVTFISSYIQSSQNVFRHLQYLIQYDKTSGKPCQNKFILICQITLIERYEMNSVE